MVNLKLPAIHAEWELLSLFFRLSNGGAEALRNVPKLLRVMGGTGKQTAWLGLHGVLLVQEGQAGASVWVVARGA